MQTNRLRAPPDPGQGPGVDQEQGVLRVGLGVPERLVEPSCYYYYYYYY